MTVGTVAAPGQDVSARRRLRGLVLGLLGLAVGGAAIAGLGLGPVPIPPGEILAMLFGQAPADPTHGAVLFAIRLPRVILGILVGAGLAVAGAAFQGLFRNPLADPGIIGVSSGGTLGAVGFIVLGPALGLDFAGIHALPLAAFAGALGATLLVARIAALAGGSTAALLLAGIAIAALAAAGTGLLVFVGDDQQLRALVFWTMGSLSAAPIDGILWGLPALLAPLVALPWLARALDAMLLGEREAHHLGLDVVRLKRIVVVATSIGVGAAVALAGVIGFIGLMAPHLARLALGPGHRLLLPAAALIGAFLMLLADITARLAVAPAELPVGIVTGCIGGPFFLWLLVHRRAGRA
ncbi:iron ABC transporter permease [Zavarzinia compransoris]|uniref:FecCD family ABC transporter permease n=1 Tax=Zavarzinia marina TaxID=2911065 RepID=UPI001F214A80|nr:iron ABC transporter permease [Zavarzinia marina]MCF4165858.1 iron ABC transporter permease [Zavarzinia marina]